jgi:hypothetical protein
MEGISMVGRVIEMLLSREIDCDTCDVVCESYKLKLENVFGNSLQIILMLPKSLPVLYFVRFHLNRLEEADRFA